jgi:hypothetical protein
MLIHQLQRKPAPTIRAPQPLHTAGMRQLDVVRTIPGQLMLAPRAITPEARRRHQAIPPLVVGEVGRAVGVFGRRYNNNGLGRVVGGGGAGGAGLDTRERGWARRAGPQDWHLGGAAEGEARPHGGGGGFLRVREDGRGDRFVDRGSGSNSGSTSPSRRGSSGRGGGSSTLLVLAAKAAKKLLQTPTEPHC